MPSNVVRHSSEEIYQTLRSSIINFEYPPGTQISENDIAKRWGISRTPAKAVFTRLQNEGLLVVLPQRGTYVSRLDSQNIRDFIYMRAVLEYDIVKTFLAVVKDPDIEALEQLLAEQEEIAKRGDPLAFLNADVAFHGYFYNRVGHPSIWNEIQKLQVHYRRFRILDLMQDCKIDALIAEHRMLLQAIKDRDPRECRRLLRLHLSGNFKKTIHSPLGDYFD